MNWVRQGGSTTFETGLSQDASPERPFFFRLYGNFDHFISIKSSVRSRVWHDVFRIDSTVKKCFLDDHIYRHEGPFLESRNIFSSPKLNIQIE